MENDGRPTIRDAVPGDVGKLLGFVRGLAEYEREQHQVMATEADLAEALFGTDPKVFALVAENAGAVAGHVDLFRFVLDMDRSARPLRRGSFRRPGATATGDGKSVACRTGGTSRPGGLSADRVGRARLEPACDRFLPLARRTPEDEWRIFRLAGDALSALGTGLK